MFTVEIILIKFYQSIHFFNYCVISVLSSDQHVQPNKNGARFFFFPHKVVGVAKQPVQK